MMPALRYLPYVLPHTRFVQYGNAEPEPATPVSLPPHPTQQDMSHSGGTSEISANAEKQQTTTEKEAVPVSNVYCPHIPHVADWLFSVRRPDSPEGRGDHASTVFNKVTICVGCATGQQNGGTCIGSCPRKGLWKVSANKVS